MVVDFDCKYKQKTQSYTIIIYYPIRCDVFACTLEETTHFNWLVLDPHPVSHLLII